MRHSFSHNPRFWDLLIALLMLCGAVSANLSFHWILAHPSSPVAVRVIIGLIGTLGLTGFFLVVWGSFIEPKRISVNKKNIHISGLPAVTIAVIADFHVGPYKGKKYIRRIVNKVHTLKPDLILLPGDFIYDNRADLADLDPLKNLRAPLGVFAVLGNHDTGHMLDRRSGRFLSYRTADRSKAIIKTLNGLNIPVLRNEQRILTHRGSMFILAGSDHRWMDSYNLQDTFRNISADTPVILLSHIPDTILDPQSHNAALIISGHTHGGQIRLPFIGSVYPIPDELGNAFDQGLFRLKSGTILAITHGIGETMARARLFCPPEILLLRIGY